MANRPTYGVTVEREEQLWTADVDGLPSDTNTATDTERFADLEQEVRDFVATVTDAEPGDFDLVWRSPSPRRLRSRNQVSSRSSGPRCGCA